MGKKNKDDVLFLCQYFYPEYITSAKLPFDIAQYLAKRGHTVGALCGYPKEYTFQYDCPRSETVKNVSISRVRYFHVKRNRFLGRILNIVSFTMFSMSHVFRVRNYKCVAVISDPPILPIVSTLAKKLFGTKVVFIAYDVFPEIAIATKSIKPKGCFSSMMRLINMKAYKNVDKVVALTDEMKDFIAESRPGVTADQITVIPNWATENLSRNPVPENYRIMDYNENQFVVSYFGNMGTCQDMDALLEAAKRLKSNKKIQFLFAGHGNKILPTLKFIDENNLDNIELWEFLDGERFEAAISVSSACVVSLEKGLKGTCAPSKYYTYLNMGSAVISIGETDSYISKEVVSEKIGFCVEVGDVDSLVKNLEYMSEHMEETNLMGSRAKRLSREKYDKKLSLSKYAEVIESVLE